MICNDEQLLELINRIVVEEHGTPVTTINKVIDSDIDSFSVTVLFLTLEEELDIELRNDLENIDWENYTVKELLDEIKEASGCN